MKSIKAGANISGLRSEMVIAWDIADQVYASFHYDDCVLTEGTGGKHGTGSLHYVGLAIDLRIWGFKTKDIQEQVCKELRKRLGPQYDAVLESDHIHIEFQPK